MKTKPKLGTVPSNSLPHEHSGGSFAAGFVMGVLTGAAGLWLSQDERGLDLLEQLKKELLDTLENESSTNSLNSEKKVTVSPTSPGVSGEKKFPKFAAKRIRRT